MDALKLAKIIGKAASDKKAQRVLIQDLSQRSDVCQYQVICSGTNDSQTQAICNSVEEMVLAKARRKPLAIEGKQTGHWILIDYGSVMVHVFMDSIRDYYALENLWPDAPSVTFEA